METIDNRQSLAGESTNTEVSNMNSYYVVKEVNNRKINW